jgi:hypothetical protein
MSEVTVGSTTTIVTEYKVVVDPKLDKGRIDPNTIVILSPEGVDALNKLLGLPGERQDDVTGLTEPSSGNSSISANDLSLTQQDCMADVLTFLMVFQKLAQEMRNSNHEIRSSELNAQVGALLASADDLTKSADLKFAAGIVQGACQSAGGLLQMGMSAASAKSSLEGMQQEKTAKTFTEKAAEEPADSDRQKIYDNIAAEQTEDARISGVNATKYHGYSQAVGSLTGGLGGIATASITLGADLADVDSKKKEAEARKHESASSQANDMMSQMMDIIRDVREKLQSMEQSRQETNRGISRNI